MAQDGQQSPENSRQGENHPGTAPFRPKSRHLPVTAPCNVLTPQTHCSFARAELLADKGLATGIENSRGPRCRLCPRMKLAVNALEARLIDVRVDLRGGDTGVAE